MDPLEEARRPRPPLDIARPPAVTYGNKLVDLMTMGDRAWGFLIVSASMLAAWLLAWGSGEATAVSRHWFYVPVVFAAARFGPIGTVATAVIAGLLAGPLVPLPGVGIGLAGRGDWIVRAGFFVAIGGLIAVLTESIRRYQQQQVDVADHARQVAARERDLAVQRAAVIQTVSHELRTPLTIINGAVITWSRMSEHIEPPGAASLIPAMERATERLHSIVSTVLAAAEADTGDDLVPVEVEMAELLTGATARVTGPEDRERVEHVIDADMTVVATVPDYVVTALSLLIDNALKFSPPDQAVTVTAQRNGSGSIEITVRDRGDGIDSIDRDASSDGIDGDATEWLFEPFTQADQSTTRAHAGLGIGLYTCRKLVDRLGGQVAIAAHADGGTVARLVLPTM